MRAVDAVVLAGRTDGGESVRRVDAAETSLSEAIRRAVVKVEMVKVESSNVVAMGYADGALFVRFASGSAYRYADVPKELWHALESPLTKSKGKFIATRIVKPTNVSQLYACEKLSPERQREFGLEVEQKKEAGAEA